MKALQIILLITGVALFLTLAGCGANGGDDGPEPSVVEEPDTVVVEEPAVEEPDTVVSEYMNPVFINRWREFYPMDSTSPLLRSLVGKWAWFKGIDRLDRVSEITPSASMFFLEYFLDGRMKESHVTVGFHREGFFALDSLQLYTNYNVRGDLLSNPAAVYIHNYSILEDGNVLRLQLYSGLTTLEWDMKTIMIDFFQLLKE